MQTGTLYVALRPPVGGGEPEPDWSTTSEHAHGARQKAAEAPKAWAQRYPVQRIAALRWSEIVEDAP